MRAVAEQPLAQGLPRLVALPQPTALAQLGHDELHEIAERPERVVLPQVDPVHPVFVEPALDLIGDHRRRSGDEVALLPAGDGLVDEVPGGLPRRHRPCERGLGLAFPLEDVRHEGVPRVGGRVDDVAVVGEDTVEARVLAVALQFLLDLGVGAPGDDTGLDDEADVVPIATVPLEGIPHPVGVAAEVGCRPPTGEDDLGVAPGELDPSG